MVEERVRVAASRTPGIRLDHFIGIAEYWAIPGNAKDATSGTWRKGPGSKLISAISGIADFVIAEDLGWRGMRRSSSRTGMAFMGWRSFNSDGGARHPHIISTTSRSG